MVSWSLTNLQSRIWSHRSYKPEMNYRLLKILVFSLTGSVHLGAHENCSNRCKHQAEAKIMGGSSEIECPYRDCRHKVTTTNPPVPPMALLLFPSSFDILDIQTYGICYPASFKVYYAFSQNVRPSWRNRKAVAVAAAAACSIICLGSRPWMKRG